jgi:hypothetical protein
MDIALVSTSTTRGDIHNGNAPFERDGRIHRSRRDFRDSRVAAATAQPRAQSGSKRQHGANGSNATEAA